MATDADDGDNGRISYQILSGNDYGLFTLNNATGELSLAKNVEIMEAHWDKSANYTFTTTLLIAAIDNGIPACFNWTPVQIRLNSSSSSATTPFFIVSKYEKYVLEDLRTGSIILHSRAVNKLGLPDDDWFYTVTDTANKVKFLSFLKHLNYLFIYSFFFNSLILIRFHCLFALISN